MTLKAQSLPAVSEQLLLFAALSRGVVGGFLKDTDAMSVLHITDEIIALDSDTEWTQYTQPDIFHTVNQLTDFECEPKYQVKVELTLTQSHPTPKTGFSAVVFFIVFQHLIQCWPYADSLLPVQYSKLENSFAFTTEWRCQFAIAHGLMHVRSKCIIIKTMCFKLLAHLFSKNTKDKT